jgi:8-oxo-dGTP diphosphatase
VEKSKVYDLPIWQGDKIFFKLIEDKQSPFFSLKLVYEGDELVHSEVKTY